MRLWHEALIPQLPRPQLLGQHRECCALRGYNVSPEWLDKNYRGKTCPPYQDLAEEKLNSPIYSEHDAAYYEECLANLCDKGIDL